MNVQAGAEPRLVVVISYDQYRGDFPRTFSRFATSQGFNRVQREGAWFPNCRFEFASTLTGPGHATLLTGCNPSRTGIVGNDFFDSAMQRTMYCVEDTVHGRSPGLLRVPTIGEKLRNRDPRSKVASIAIKDRAAILMAGKSAYPVLWFEASAGGFTTSTYYRRPPWLGILNSSIRFTDWSNRTWRAGIPDSLDPARDDVPAEGTMSGGRRSFPYRMPDADVHPKEYAEDFVRAPYSVSYLFDAAWEVIRRERLGQDTIADMLCIGVSTTDMLGHTFGPDSREVQELYRACDTTLARFIGDLDEAIGREHYVLVISSDHGVAPVPEVIRQAAQAQGVEVDAGRLLRKQIAHSVDSALNAHVGATDSGTWVREFHVPSIWLDTLRCYQFGISRTLAASVATAALRNVHGIAIAITHEDVASGLPCSPDIGPDNCLLLRNSFDADRSGDVVLYPSRYWVLGSAPATHGSLHDYDRHVPLMIMGGGIPAAELTAAVSPADIAPTLATLLGLTLENVDGKPLPLFQTSK